MNKKQRIGLFLGIATAVTGGYFWYKNQKPKFEILEFNNHKKTVRWRYGKTVKLTEAGNKNSYYLVRNADFFVKARPMIVDEEVVGISFDFYGKDTRDPKFINFK